MEASTTRSDERRRVAAIYDRLAPDYDRMEGAVERTLMGRSMRAALGAELRGSVLEVAIGSGRNLPFYSEAVTSVVGVDLSAGMLAEARRAGVEAGRPVTLARMDAEGLAFPAATFDTVVTSLSLCTVADPARALREMARVCKPDGRIVLLEHVRSPVPPLAWLQRLLAPLQVRAMGCHLDRETIALVRDLGFTVLSERRRFFGVFRLVVARPPRSAPRSHNRSYAASNSLSHKSAKTGSLADVSPSGNSTLSQASRRSRSTRPLCLDMLRRAVPSDVSSVRHRR
jgi:ubiquinone/menaquinone biosynthesis C-methylase UbiE